jgi:SAM-dependent methyltransferase
VLEVGSGRGEFAEIVRAEGFGYIGIEPSTTMRKELVDRGFEILSRPVPAINLTDESVDLVYSNALIEHLENYSAAVGFFGEARRVLRKGGVMASVVPNYDTCGMIFFSQDYQHNFVTNRGRLDHLCRDTGLEVLATPSFLTNLALTPISFLDRILAHTVLLFMRRPLVSSLVPEQA